MKILVFGLPGSGKTTFAKQLTQASLKNIGMYFGGRDHSTVIHACQTVNDLIDTDKKFKSDVDELAKRIKINTY